MPARAASDDDLNVTLLAHCFCGNRILLAAAESAASGSGIALGSLLGHAAALRACMVSTCCGT